jgi:hypothetical protein
MEPDYNHEWETDGWQQQEEEQRWMEEKMEMTASESYIVVVARSGADFQEWLNGSWINDNIEIFGPYTDEQVHRARRRLAERESRLNRGERIILFHQLARHIDPTKEVEPEAAA